MLFGMLVAAVVLLVGFIGNKVTGDKLWWLKFGKRTFKPRHRG